MQRCMQQNGIRCWNLRLYGVALRVSPTAPLYCPHTTAQHQPVSFKVGAGAHSAVFAASLVGSHVGPFDTVSTHTHVDAGIRQGRAVGTLAGAAEEFLCEPLTFVNRYAEALHALLPNLANHEEVRRANDVNMFTRLAAQPPGWRRQNYAGQTSDRYPSAAHQT